jgi:hypothetical protein
MGGIPKQPFPQLFAVIAITFRQAKRASERQFSLAGEGI